MKRTGTRLTIRLFLPYGLLLVMLAAVIGSFLGYHIFSLHKKNTLSLFTSSLLTAADNMDTLIAELDSVAYEVSTNRTALPYVALKNGYAANLVTRLLTALKSANTYLADIVLYYDKAVALQYTSMPKYFTSTGSFDSAVFWNSIHPLKDLNGPLFESMIPLCRQPALYYPVAENTKTSHKDYLLYLCPLANASGAVNERGVILFLIDRDILSDALAQVPRANDGSLRVFGGSGQLIFADNTDGGTALPVVWDDLPAGSQDAPVLTQLGSGALRLSLRTAGRGFTYVMDLPASALPSAMVSLLPIILPLIVALLLPVLFLTYWLIRRLFRPIVQVTDILSAFNPGGGASLTSVAVSLRSLEEQKNRLVTKMEKQTDFVRMQCLYELLQGSLGESEVLDEQLAALVKEWEAEWLCVAVAQLSCPAGEKSGGAGLSERFLQQLSTDEMKRLGLKYAIPGSLPDQFILLLGIREDTQAQPALKELLETLGAAMARRFRCALTFGVGGPVRLLVELSASYRQAMKAISDQFILGSGKVLFYKDAHAGRSEHVIWYPADQEDKLLHALSAAQADQACDLAKEIFLDIREQRPSLPAAKGICISLCNQALTLFHAGAGELDPLGLTLMELRDGLSDSNATLDAFQAQFLAYCAGICEKRMQERQTHGDQVCRQIKEYLGTHYGDPMLTLTVLSDQFGMSGGHLTRLFKEQSGVSVMQYLNDLRIEAAKKLLAETSLPLHEIVTMCGYVDKSNFIRKFKNLCGVTPMMYRSLHRQP